MNYYSEDLFDIKESLQTSEEGLSPDEAAKRLTEHGKNALQEKKKKPLIVKFLEQFKDVMIIVLIAAAIVSAALTIYTKEYSELIESGLILLIVIVNAIIGVVQENKAESALEALKNLNKPYSKVIRGGALVQIKSEEIVPGDVVQLEAGDIVPCDLRLFSSASLKIEEAALTGESVPVEKDADAQIAENAPLGDRKNMAYGSGIVSYGRGRGIAVHTGMETEVGKIAKMLETGSNDGTPLQKQLNKTAKVLSVLVLAIAVVIFAVSLADDTSQWINAFMTAVAIAVAAIPEGLPAVVTVVLAIGVQRMSKRNAIIRNLPAVETLGCCEIICSDKTGTLTLNKMTVKRLYTVSGGLMNDTDYAANTAGTGDADVLVRAMTLCNDTTEGVAGLAGDPTETALVAFYTDKGGKFADLKEEWRRVDEVPFDSVRKMMTTVNEHDGKRVAHIKGATDIMLKECKKVLDGGKVREMTADDIESIGEANAAMASVKSIGRSGKIRRHGRYGQYRKGYGVRRLGRNDRSSASRSQRRRQSGYRRRHAPDNDHGRPPRHRGSYRKRNRHTPRRRQSYGRVRNRRSVRRGIQKSHKRVFGLCPSQPRKQSQNSPRIPFIRARRSHDGRRSQRRSVDKGSRYRHRHGYHRYRRIEGRRRHDLGGRQLCDDRVRGGRGQKDIPKYQKGNSVFAVRQYRGSAVPVHRDGVFKDRIFNPDHDIVGEPCDRQSAGVVVRHGKSRIRRHEQTAQKDRRQPVPRKDGIGYSYPGHNANGLGNDVVLLGTLRFGRFQRIRGNDHGVYQPVHDTAVPQLQSETSGQQHRP